jgi:hypothetical protein
MIENFKNWNILETARTWYGRFERPISSLSLIGGFVFDAVTLRQVGQFWENFWVIAHLAIVGTAIILINALHADVGDEADPSKWHFWLVNILQFFFGGILSTYLVFYFRSGSIAVSWPFILLLGLAFYANESFKRHYIRLSFQVSLFYLSLFSFAIFLVPVLMHKIGVGIFLLSGLISLVCMWIFLIILFFFTKGNIRKQRKIILLSIGSIFVLVNIFYFTNLIPPIPLSLKDSGVYHSVVKNSDGSYGVTYEKQPWYDFFNPYDTIHVVQGDPVYIYSAIFSPSELDVNIVHDWQYYDAQTERWIDEGKVPLSLVGGRGNGFRTYSFRTDLTVGKWRVNVDTTNGQVIGVVRFNEVDVATEPSVLSEVK